MRKLKERFHRKHGIFRPVFSLILVLAMIMTMIPSIGGNLVKAASTPMNVTIHFMEPSTWGWTQPAVQFWDHKTIEVSDDANGGKSTEIPNWGGQKVISSVKEQQQIQMATKIIILLSKQMQKDFSF